MDDKYMLSPPTSAPPGLPVSETTPLRQIVAEATEHALRLARRGKRPFALSWKDD